MALLELFDEGRYRPAVPFRAAYYEAVRGGAAQLLQLTVAICGLARNISLHADRVLAKIERTRRLCRASTVFFYENDSQDDTAARLAAYAAAHPGVTLLSQRRRDPVNPPTRDLARAQRMAGYRNQYLDWLRQQQPLPDVVLVLDMDLAGWSYEGLAHTFAHWGTWDMVGSNGLYYHPHFPHPLYYDAWAYRAFGHDAPLPTEVVNHFRWLRGEPLVPLNSCFGGLGVYRTEALLRGRYDGGDCEHVHLHRRLRENGFGRIYLNPSQITVYP